MCGWWWVACKIIVSAPVPFLFLWTLDFDFLDLNLWLGFGTWNWDLDLGLGIGLGLDNNKICRDFHFFIALSFWYNFGHIQMLVFGANILTVIIHINDNLPRFELQNIIKTKPWFRSVAASSFTFYKGGGSDIIIESFVCRSNWGMSVYKYEKWEKHSHDFIS